MNLPRSVSSARGKRSFTLVEVLISVTIISCTFIPIFYLANANVQATRIQSVRFVCESLARAVLDCFGRAEFQKSHLLKPTSDPHVFEANDLWNQHPMLVHLVDSDQMQRIVKSYDVHNTVAVHLDVEPGLHKVISEVSWRTSMGGRIGRDEVTYSRLYTDVQVLQ